MGRRTVNTSLLDSYTALYHHFGKQNWWPADTKFEVIIGAILTQNTNWQNVEKAISNLRKKKLLRLDKLKNIKTSALAQLIRPAGYYNIKAQRLKNFIDFLYQRYQGSLKKMFKRRLSILRDELLSVNGIGPETADSILLYAGNKPVFVVDAYTRRILSRHRLIKKDASYQDIQDLFHSTLEEKSSLYNEYHALLVELAKNYCKKNKSCEGCPWPRKKLVRKK